MAEISESNENDAVLAIRDSGIFFSITFIQKLLAEVLGTYFLIFAGCASVVINVNNDKVVSLPGISMVWGLAVTVPFYMVAQVIGSTMAAGTLRLLFNGPHDVFAGTLPQGSDLQAFVIEFIITFYLMFIVSGVATDDRTADNRSVDEPGKELRTCNCVEPLQGNMDISYITGHRGSVGCLGLQHVEVDRQAIAGHHQGHNFM
ncbi:hypothetical protein V6N12_063624 [Hibiscus sabdariffa]|uniref:Uncharacterized protein n=1 Tax=Hibiscus sabdariffa TaxID=183260 RepID=A0ABR2FC93_9ROSI